MPYSGSIQLVNDANGTTYGFLADDGAIWQCQWNAEAQRWEQGQVIPQAFGGKSPQVLYLDDLWPINAGQSDPANPGLVLAYRLGDGSQAEIYASFAAWGSDGQLSWSALVALTNDEAEDQQFSLVPGENGLFNLVVQKQEAGVSLDEQLEQQDILSVGQNNEERLQQLAVGSRPDQDLYVSSFKLENSSIGIELQQLSKPQAQETNPAQEKNPWKLVATLEAAEQSTDPVTSPQQPAFATTAELQRSLLLPKPAPELGATPDSDPSNGDDNDDNGDSTKPFNLGGNFLRLGNPAVTGSLSAGVGLFPTRWTFSVYTSKNEEASPAADFPEDVSDDGSFTNSGADLMDSEGELDESLRQTSQYEKMSSGGFPDEHGSSFSNLIPIGGVFDNFGRVNKGGGGLVILFSGLFGGINQGSRSSAAVNTARVEFLWPKKGSGELNNAMVGMAISDEGNNISSIRDGKNQVLKGFQSSWQAISGGGGLKMLFSYGVGFRNEFNLKNYSSVETFGFGYIYHDTKNSAEGTTQRTIAVNTGFEAVQDYSDNVAPLPEWLSILGRMIELESEVANAYGFYRGSRSDGKVTGSSKLSATNNPGTNWLNPNNKTESNKHVQLSAGLFGALNGIIVPAFTEGFLVSETDSDDKPKKSYGWYGNVMSAYEKLKPKGYGYKAIGFDQLNWLAGDAQGQIKNITYASVGSAIRFGIYIPLLTYYRKNTYNPFKESSSTEETQPNEDLGLGESSTASESQGQFSSTGSYYSARTGADYPFLYNPDSPSASRILSSSGGQNAEVLGGFVSTLYQFKLNETSDVDAFKIRYAGSGLTPTSEPVEVSILGPSLDSQDISNRAKASVTISQSGEIDSIVISQGGSYLYLAETGDKTGEYILPLDLASADLIAPNGNPPIISVIGSQALNAPLTLTPIQRIAAQYYSVGSSTIEQRILNYPQLDQDGKVVQANSNNENTYYYTGVPLVVSAVDSNSNITLLNKTSTARVSISNGKVIGIEPEQELFFDAVDASDNGYNITADIRAYGKQIKNDKLIILPPVTVTIATAESNAYNNVVSETEFSRQVGAINSGVYIADGIEDNIPLFPEYGSRPIASRVVWVNTSYDEQSKKLNTTRWYLNVTSSVGKGVTVQPNYINEVKSTDLPSFSAAISPAAVTIEGPYQPSQSGFAGDTLVAWVESTDPVVPITNADGEQSFQDFMQALYGNQRINYRINRTTTSTGWTSLDETDLDQLYQPDGAMITELRAFNVNNTTFLAWTEIPLADGSQPAAIKVAQINSEAASFQWDALTTDSSGNSTISTIPWDGSHAAALVINDLSMASVTSTDADGKLVETPILSFSRDVRTPYRQSVLNDEPELYLQFGALSAGTNSINIADTTSDTTLTYASDSGLDFSIASALPKSQSTAVANTNGTGVLISQLGTNNAAIRNLLVQVPPDELLPIDGGVIAEFSGSIAIEPNSEVHSLLTVTDVSSGTVSLGSALTGVGVRPGTTITEVVTPFVPATDSTPATAGSYKVSEPQTLSSTSFKAYPDPTNYAYNSVKLFIDGTTLTTTDNASVVLNTGDRIGGLGIKQGTTITAVNRNSEGAVLSYSVDLEQTVGSSESPLTAIAAPGGTSAPYTIEFWTQTTPESNPSGAGLVAYGQPSVSAIGEAALPEGWLLESSFVVDRITYQQAAARGETSASEAIANGTNGADLYAWGWAVLANGANTTTLQGNGGSNLYSNAVELNNLRAGVTLSGVTAFLNANGVPPSELDGVGGTPADVISRVPQTQLQFAHFIDEDPSSPSFGRATSNLNTIAIDTSSATLNEGVLLAADASDNSTIAENINNLFESLWQFQQKTGEAKVTFSLAANPENPATSSSTPLSIDQFAGYELGFSLSSGPAVSINQRDELVFDVAPGVSLLGPSLVRFELINNLAEHYGQDNNSLVAALWENPRAELSDIADLIVQADSSGTLIASNILNELQNQELSILAEHQASPPWFYVAASYLPEYRDFVTAEGTVVQIPSNSGTASIYINGQLAAQSTVSAPVIDAYELENINDQLLILSNHNKGAIDQLAIYNEALSTSTTPAIPSGWDVPSTDDALIMLREVGLLIDTKTPDRGAIPGAVTAHWDARNVNPNDAELSTFYSVFTPAGPGELTGSWSSPTTINPVLAPVPTIPSARSVLSSLQDNWLLALPTTDWANSTWSISPSPTSSTTPTGFNPSGRQLKSIQVKFDSISPAITLHPEQVMLGDTTLSELQPLSRKDDLKYTILNNAPAFTLLIDRNDAQNHDQASISFNFSDGTTATSTALEFNNVAQVQTNLKATPADPTQNGVQPIGAAVQESNKALATAAVIEQAPLQLKYVDSGEVFRSASSASTSDQNAASTPAQSFGTSQVAGSFGSTNGGFYSGWLAIAQPRSTDAVSDPGGRVWVQYTGDFTKNSNGTRTAVTDPAAAPITWLNALADSNFSPNEPNRPLLSSATYQSSTGGLLILADATVGWGDGFGEVMLTADLNNDGIEDLVISAPQANGGGRVYIINGTWIQNNLTSDNGATTLNLANPDEYGDYVIVLTPNVVENSTTDDAGLSDFGSALAFDQTNKTLWIGAPNYLRQLNTKDPESFTGVQPIGALYQFDTSGLNWSSAAPQSPTLWQTGEGGTSTVAGPDGSPTTSYWGSKFGSAIAVSRDGGMAVSAPGFSAGLLYSGTQAARETYGPESKRNPSSPYGDGALIGVQLPTQQEPNQLPGFDISKGTNSDFTAITTGNKPTDIQSTYMQNLKDLQTASIAGATINNNQAVQSETIGAVYLYNVGSSAPNSTLYGPGPWNVIGGSGFGSSLVFIDLGNQNTDNQLAIGADATGGSGAVYLIDKTAIDQQVTDQSGSLGDNQYLAHAVASLTLYGAETQDFFGGGLVNLGDINNDQYDDLLIQAMNAASAAGAGYVLFGSDQFDEALKNNPAVGSVSSGSIGQFKQADGSSFTTSILQELGFGKGFTGSGTFGSGDINADGINDIQLGSGPNGSAYLTWGHPYMEAINNLALNKLASNTGYMLDGLATSTAGSLRSIGDFNGDGYGDFITIEPGELVNNVRIELGANTQEILADYLYNHYNFTVSLDTQVLPAGDINGDGLADIALFLNDNLSSTADGNQGAGSTTGVLFGRSSDSLPIGSGFGFLSPVEPDSNSPLLALPGQQISGGLSNTSPSVIAEGNTLYAAVKGTGDGDTSIWFAQSSDGGSTWSAWANLSTQEPGFATNTAPALGFYEQTLYLGFTDPGGALQISSFDPASTSLTSWSRPAVIATTQSDSSTFSSSFAPAFLNQGDALALLWIDSSSSDGEISNTLYSAVSTTPDIASSSYTPWSGVDGGSSPAAPALAQLGDTLYMAVQGNSDNLIYWNSSTDGGTSWADWQALPTGMTSANPPSLAAFDGTLYLSYLGDGNNEINITSLNDAASNSWATQYVIPWNGGSQSARQASLVSETINGSEQLSVYYIATNDTSDLLRTASGNPSVATDWSQPITIEYNNGAASQTASGPLAVISQYGQTVIAYQGGTVKNPSTEIYLATSSSPDTSSSWSAQAYTDPGQSTGLGLAQTGDGLLLSYSSSASPDVLQLQTLSLDGSTWETSDTNSTALISSGSKLVSILQADTNSSFGLLLAGINGSSKDIEVSVAERYATSDSWTEPKQLLQRSVAANGTVDFNPITATAAPVATLLGVDPVVALNNDGTINLYIPSASGSSLTLASSFSATQNNEPAISRTTAAGLTSTDTGLALSYTNDDQSVSLQRLDFFSLDGATADGVNLSADGFVSTDTDLLWQTTLIDSINGGMSTNLASVPVVVDGNLLLTSIDANSDAVQINVVPALHEPDSSSWINSTIQLPDGAGDWLISQSNASAPSTLTAVGDIDGDGNDDLIVTNPDLDIITASNTTTSTSGLRLISGAATPDRWLINNNPVADEQTVQLAPVLPGTTQATTISAALTGSGSLSLNALSGDDAYSVSGSFTDPDTWLASANAANPIASAQQLFSNAIAEADGWASTPAGPLSGDPAFNTTTSFGDLNGDGYEDYFDASSSLWIASAPQAPVFSLWSLRAAGDVNGNGVDDILLALTPQGPSYQAQSDGKPAAIYSALIDGALFNVDQTTNTFNLSDLKAALNPYNSIELYDVTTSSYSDEYQSLQNWFSPILKYQAPASVNTVENLISTNPTGRTTNSPAPTITRDDQGNLYTVTTLVNEYDLSSIMHVGIGQNSLDPNNVHYIPIDLSIIPKSLSGGSFPSTSIAPLTPGAAIHNGKLFVAIPSAKNTKDGYGSTTNDIWIAYANLGDYDYLSEVSNWTSYLLSSNQNTNSEYTYLTPTLVSEGERLAVYFPAGDEGNNDENLLIHYLYSNDPTSPDAWGSTLGEDNAYTGSSSTISIDTNLSTTPPVKGWSSNGDVIVTSPIAATTYQGRTVLAFRGYAKGGGDNVKNGDLLLAFAPTAVGASANNMSVSADWTLWSSNTTEINTPSITTDQANLYITYTPWDTSSPDAYFFPVALNIDNLSPDQPVDLKSSSLVKDTNDYKVPITLQQAGRNGMTTSNYANGYFTGAETQTNNIGNAPQAVTPSIDGNKLYFTNQVNGTYPGTMSAAVSIDYATDIPSFGVNQINRRGYSLAGYSLDGNIDVNGDGFSDILLSDPSDPSLAVDNQYVLFGGDFLDIANQVGTNGDDTLIGSPLADVIYSLAGDDTVITNGGADVVYTGAGGDTIAITGNDFFRIDTGAGIDSLLLHGDVDQRYDFRLDGLAVREYYPGTKLKNIELISSIDYGSNTLSFDPKAISAFNDDRMLFLTPDSSDQIKLYNDDYFTFSRYASFDTNFGGVTWNAYATSSEVQSFDSPALVYVLNPEPGDDSWLTTNVNIYTASSAADKASQEVLHATEAPLAPTSSLVAEVVAFGEGLKLTAFKSSPGDAFARFELSRSNTESAQVISYATSTLNSNAEPGIHYKAVAGIVRMVKGQSSQIITVPLISQAIQQLRTSGVSLQVEELQDLNQNEMNLVIESAASDGYPSAQPPTLSNFKLEASKNLPSALLTFNADVNPSTSELKLKVAQRDHSYSSSIKTSKDLSIADYLPSSKVLPVKDPLTGIYRLDALENTNQQVSARFELNLDPDAEGAALSLLGPNKSTDSNFTLSTSTAFSIRQQGPLTSWRSDSTSGLIDFSLQSSSGDRFELLSNAAPAQDGAINGLTMPLGNWLTTEGKAIGSTAAFSNPQLSGQTWTPVATRDGVELKLERLSVEGNNLNAIFSGGVRAHLSFDSTPTTPSEQPLTPEVTVHRLGAYNNDLGFYRVDDLTGRIDGLSPSDAGYLQAALARSQADDLLLTSEQLPGYREAATFTDLSLNLNDQYGLILAVDGNPNTLYSSFSAANPNGAVQMINLNSQINSDVTTIGIEDLAYNPNNPTSSDYNDFILKIANFATVNIL